MVSFFRRLWSGVFMVFGTTVGAGMLGIPAMTADAGFWPAVGVTILVWLFMMITGLLLLEVAIAMPKGSNLLSIAGKFLGRQGKWITGFFFLFLYYCLLVAYFSGGFPLLGQVFSVIGLPLSPTLEKVVFAVSFGGLIALGMHWINRANVLLTFGMLVSYAAVICVGSKGVSSKELSFMQVSFAAAAVPVLFSAFGFHNIIPSLADYFHRDKKTLRLSIIGGTFLALVFYVAWLWLVLGSIPISVLDSVRAQGLPVTYALSAASEGAFIYVCGQIFAFLALTTSFLGVGFSFVDFVQDGLRENQIHTSRIVSVAITLLPPFICVLFIPALFEKALGVAGGFGEAILNGLLPVMLFAKIKPFSSVKMKTCLAFLVAISFAVAFLELYFLCFS
jgi:tyrosine-specific transport protein